MKSLLISAVCVLLVSCATSPDLSQMSSFERQAYLQQQQIEAQKLYNLGQGLEDASAHMINGLYPGGRANVKQSQEDAMNNFAQQRRDRQILWNDNNRARREQYQQMRRPIQKSSSPVYNSGIYNSFY